MGWASDSSEALQNFKDFIQEKDRSPIVGLLNMEELRRFVDMAILLSSHKEGISSCLNFVFSELSGYKKYSAPFCKTLIYCLSHKTMFLIPSSIDSEKNLFYFRSA